MKLNDYQLLAGRTMNPHLSDYDTMYHALHGMVGEIGEIHSMFQKVHQGHDIDVVHLKKELGDLLWFIAEFATVNRWELSEIAQMNIEKLKARYPDGFAEEQSLHRNEGDV